MVWTMEKLVVIIKHVPGYGPKFGRVPEQSFKKELTALEVMSVSPKRSSGSI